MLIYSLEKGDFFMEKELAVQALMFLNNTNALTNGAGSIFPPDIFNIKDDFLPIINETITCDDLTLKYFATIKAIPHKWIVNIINDFYIYK